MKILFLTSKFPYPPTDGIKIKVYNLMRRLSERHELFLQSVYENPSDVKPENIKHISRYCRIISLHKRNQQRPILMRSLLNITGEIPSFVRDYGSDEMNKTLDCVIKSIKPDIVHFDGINMFPYLNIINGRTPSVISPNDSLSLALKDEFLRLPLSSFHRKIYSLLQLANIKRLEKNWYSKFQKCYVVSEVDKNYLHKLNPDIDADVIPNGVDIEFFKPDNIASDDPSLIYSGDMSGGNATYALCFIRKVLPRIKKVLPDIKLYLVGNNPKDSLKSTVSNDENIIVTGYVDDIRPYLNRATLSISPVLKSCGILNKVLEAMAMGKAVIGTKCSFNGIKDSVHGVNMMAADSSREFTELILKLINNATLRKKIGTNARKLIKEQYTWDKSAQKAEIMYQQAVAKFNYISPKKFISSMIITQHI